MPLTDARAGELARLDAMANEYCVNPSAFSVSAVRGMTELYQRLASTLLTERAALREVLQYVMSAHGEQLHDAFDMAQRALIGGSDGK